MSNGIQETMESCVFNVPKHRSEHMKKQWEHIRIMLIGRKINLHVNLEDGIVELATQPDTPDIGDIARCAKFIQAVIMGFSIPVAQILLHRDNVLVESLSIKETDLQVQKRLNAKLMHRNISKTKMAIESFTGTNISMDTSEIYILGSSSCVRHCKDYIHHLISLY